MSRLELYSGQVWTHDRKIMEHSLYQLCHRALICIFIYSFRSSFVLSLYWYGKRLKNGQMRLPNSYWICKESIWVKSLWTTKDIHVVLSKQICWFKIGVDISDGVKKWNSFVVNCGLSQKNVICCLGICMFIVSIRCVDNFI